MIAKALKLFCPRAAKWIQVHFQKEKEVEQTEVSQFLPCDSESFPRSVWEAGWTHITSVPPQSFPENISPPVTQMSMCKTKEKHTENMAKLDFETNYFIITSYGEYLLCRGNAVPGAQFQHSHPRRVLLLLQGKQHRQRGREQGTSQTRGDHWFIAVRVEAQGLCTDSLKCSVPWKAGAACAKSLQSIR